MFNSCEFSFNNESSAMYGLMIYDFDSKSQSEVSFGNKANIIETRINNRIQPIHLGVNYHAEPLEFTLVFGSERALDRYELEDISLWLTGHQQYQWLSIDQPDMDSFRYRCLITKLTPLMHGWLPVAFEATILCDCSYAYGLEFNKEFIISEETNILFRNHSSVRDYLYPNIVFIPNTSTKALSIINQNDNNREFKLDGLPSSSLNITIDNTNGIIKENVYGYNLYDGFNLNFFRLIQGDNNLIINGNGTLIISGRFLHNIAG